jgi:putative radical SAM enzyme (TIGR03279 family)
MMRISSVKVRSLAERHHVQVGEQLLSINGHRISDPIDYRFYQADESLQLHLRNKEGKIYSLEITKDPDEDLGLVLEEPKYRSCPNKCIFCFVHQLPGGLRKSLYFKDEDYRLSFLYGNYITLTNLTPKDIKRIREQNLSPLYISVHTTDEALRKRMLGNSKAPDLLPLMRKLTEAGIELHTQVVVCPGVNDGEVLEKTVEDLASLFPEVKSLAVVPVGLTRFRKGLPKIEPLDEEKAMELLSLVNRWRGWARKTLGANFVYASDELYLLCNLDIPKSDYYDDFWQIENGVGLVRRFVDDFEKNSQMLPEALPRPVEVNFVTGKLASTIFEETVIRRLKRIKNLKASLTVIENDFFGETVTVSGLLTGKDILRALEEKGQSDSATFVPPDCVNDQGFLLDDLKTQELCERSGQKVILGRYDLASQLAAFLKKGM